MSSLCILGINPLLEICMQVKKQQLEMYMEKQTGSKSGKEYIKAVYCLPAYLTYMWSYLPYILNLYSLFNLYSFIQKN